jgi:hypothetical protein
MFRFSVNPGMNKPSFHIIDRLEWFIVDIEEKVSIPSQDAILAGRVKVLNKNVKFSDFWTKESLLMISVSQQGWQKATYNSRFIVKLGGDEIVRIDCFGKPGPLFFEGEGKILDTAAIIKYDLDFACDSKRTAPAVIARKLVTTSEEGFTASTLGRGIHIMKEE